CFPLLLPEDNGRGPQRPPPARQHLRQVVRSAPLAGPSARALPEHPAHPALAVARRCAAAVRNGRYAPAHPMYLVIGRPMDQAVQTWRVPDRSPPGLPAAPLLAEPF